MARISQREAQRLRKQVKELIAKLDGLRRTWGNDYPGVHILTVSRGEGIDDSDLAVLRTARKLGHPVVVTLDGNSIYFNGVR